ncbi:YrzI family small protein [Lederbergia citrea]|uniref:YrzI family small protein n=1 Tax=Lederbergia citrea TaxID=2833581 RepID=A0A942Z549_9BACI|nr:YrzI family small protein [Lederbergia citrea]MBS4178422.1 YrzI family small protein [Lederbergia citrea]MBS4205097.1 YrzI family small protein [Lederbergia citrea]MBS4223047.1 YrzI family small protein [Lederbergia citrea]
MTLNILFMTITIKKRKMTVEEALHHREVQKIYDENRDRQISLYRPY